MIANGSSSVAMPLRRSLAARLVSKGRLAAIGVAVALFMVRFKPSESRPLADAVWLLALCLWVSEVRARNGHRLLTLRWQRRDVLPIAVLLMTLVVAWLPFYDNWRWAYTGDSIAWYGIAEQVVRNHLGQDVLSVHGVDDNFTLVHGLAFNSLMFVFGPTLFWHRVGKLIVSCIGLAAMYGFFTLTVGRWWAVATVFATATNYVWLWFSYVSYAHVDSYIFYFVTLILALLIRRNPDQLGLWMMCGLVGGLSLFFTQTSWSVVALTALVLGTWALLTRRVGAVVVYATSFLLVAIPILLQFHDFLHMTTHQARSIWEWNYLAHIFRAILLLPYQWSRYNIGVQGAFLHWPLGPLYILGVGVSLLAVLPPLRRALRVPPVAPLLLGLLLWDAVLMTLTNNGYGEPSTKRVYSLIPIQVFLALVPLMVVTAWSGGHRWMHAASSGLTVVLLGAYVAVNLHLIMYPPPRIYGTNLFDGLVELRQCFPEKPVVLFSSRDHMPEWVLGPESPVDRFYHLRDTVTVQPELTFPRLQGACAAHSVLCYEPNFDAAAFDAMAGPMRPCLKPFPLLNSEEMRCVECDPTACALS
jgi:heme/copper-type cytochrome/quinol oxidase subunit 4